jgi:putative peptidoglycan lipid II flippase
MDRKKRILKSAGAIGLATAGSRVLGFIRDTILAWVLGASFSMDAFAVAYRLANLFRRLLAEGAMNAAFIPVFAEFRQRHSSEELWEFARKFFYTLALISSVMVIFEIVFAPLIVRILAPGFYDDPHKWTLTITLTRIMAPYMIFVSVTAFLMGILNSFGYFVVPALSPIFFNLAVIGASFLSFHFFKSPVYGIAFGVLIGGILQFAYQIPLAHRLGMRFKIGFSLTHPAIQKASQLLAPSILGMGIVHVNLLVSLLMASFLSEGSVSQIYYADRIMGLVLGIFVISLNTVALPEMSRLAAENNLNKLKDTLMFSLRAAAFITIPATLGLFLLSDPIVHVLFEHGCFTPLDTERTAAAVSYFALGIFFTSVTRLFIPAFYALQDTKTPVKVALISLFVSVFLNWGLMHPLKQGGIALAVSITSGVSFFQLAFIFQRKFGSLDWTKFNKSFIRILMASAIMGVSCLISLQLFGFDKGQPFILKAAALFGTIGLGILVYSAMTLLLQMDEIRSFKMRLTSKRAP